MAEQPQIKDSDIPEFVRRCWERYRDATKELREASTESRRMFVGGKYQWRDNEISARMGANRPIMSVNRCRPAVDQVTNEAIANAPGPEAQPVGGGADKYGADILEGLIREYEYRSDAQTAYVQGALQSALAGNAGVFELATEYAGERSFEQRLTVKMQDDIDCYFVDPDSRMPNREDAMWCGKIRVLSREKLISEYGHKLQVLSRNMVDRYAGWIASALNWTGNVASLAEWTGNKDGSGPFYVCEFFLARVELDTLTEYDNHVAYFADEEKPRGAKPVEEDGEIKTRQVPRKRFTKYVITALDILKKTEWLGDQIPHFWVLGPETYIDGRLYRLSLLDGAIDMQRGLNYAITAGFEVVGAMNKSAALLGYQGQFDVANAQGINQWTDYSTKMYAYMEVKPVFAVSPDGQSTLLPPPQRNAWEAPIARMLELATWCAEQIKAATSVFFDPSQQSVRDVQSGEAIKELQSQTNIGTTNWQKALQRAVALSYRQAAIILPKITPRNAARTIIRPDSSREVAQINRDFPESTHEMLDRGRFRNRKTGQIELANEIGIGEYSLRVTAGPNTRVRTEKALNRFMEVLRIAPQITQAPGVLAQIVRMVGEGSPEMEQMADAIMPNGLEDLTPDQLKQRITALQQSDQQKQALINNMQQALLAKLPEIQAKERQALLQAAVDLAKAEMAAKAQTGARQSADNLAMMEMAHETGLQVMDQAHQAQMQQNAPQPQPQATQ